MSAADLPDDLEKWPADPYRILGVGRNVDARELRRAYMRRIRKFKPEHYPEHFRRIRDAYESLQYCVADNDYEEQLAPPAADPPVDMVAPPRAEPEADESQVAPPALEQRLERLWRPALQGDLAAAYARSAEMRRQVPQHEEPYLRLYWLLVLDPQLDPQRAAAAWLTDGLRATGLAWRLLEPYRWELEDRPEEALSERCAALFDVPDAAQRVADLADLRWRALCDAGRWRVIRDDLERLRRSGGQENVYLWARLLMAAMDHLAWIDNPDARTLFASCLAEAEKCGEEQRALAEMLSRYDYLQELSAFIRDPRWAASFMAPFAQALERLVRLSWNRPLDWVRPLLLDFLAPLMSRPAQGLSLFGKMGNDAKLALQHVGELIEALYQERNPDPTIRDAARFEREVLELLLWYTARGYASVRPRLVTFLAAEAVPLGMLLEVLTNTPHACALGGAELDRHERNVHDPWVRRLPGGAHASLAAEIAADAPLRYYTAAYQAFWL